MYTYLIYLLETSACLLVLLLFYKSALSPLTFYQSRRFFLIISIAVSFLLPALNVKTDPFTAPVPILNLPVTQTNIQPTPVANTATAATLKTALPEKSSTPTPVYTMENLLAVAYLSAFIFLSTKLFFGIYRIRTLAKRSQQINFKGNIIYHHHSGIAAFSFFKYIFINPELLTSEKEITSILEHELVHVKQKHSCDLLFFEIMKILLWFNPVIYLMKKELEKVHEYLADQKSCEHTGKETYSRMLLKYALNLPQPGWVHSFAMLPLKTRVSELFRARSSGFSRFRLAFSAPLVFVLFLVFSCSYELDPGQSLFPNGKRLKSIKVVYHDEYGDMPQYDGQYYSWAEFDRAGKILELKKGTLFESQIHGSKTVLNDPTYPAIQDSKIIWKLDYHHYGGEAMLFFENPDMYVIAKMKQNENDTTTKMIKNEAGLPLSITKSFNFGETISTGTFEYDNQGRITEFTETHSIEDTKLKGIKYNFSSTTRVEYTSFGKVDRVIAGDIVHQLSYDEAGNIIEVNRDRIRYVFEYDEDGIRSKSFAYNPDGTLEYSLDYEYEFY